MLLSIIIPTKNRQYTTLYAIESALLINKENIEIIVQDCSDTNILQKQLFEKFGNDPRISYSYTSEKPSMTDNWNNAFERATGEYLCAIGDDDAVLPSLYKTTEWAKANNIIAVTQKDFLIYFWPGYEPQKFNGSFHYSNNISHQIELINNLQERLETYSTLKRPMDYMFLPQAYHCLFSRKLMVKLKNDTGVFLDSTSLDVYTSIAFAKYITEYAQSNLPFTIRGACSSSNTQRLSTKKAYEHFKEFKKIDFPKQLPTTFDFYTTVAESFIKACYQTRQEYLIKNINLPLLYADIASNDFNSYAQCKKKLKENVGSRIKRFLFYYHFILNYLQSFKRSIISGIKIFFPFIFWMYRKMRPLKNKKIVVQASTIREAISIIGKELLVVEVKNREPELGETILKSG